MSFFLSSSSLLVLASASPASTSISVSLLDASCVGSKDCFSGETLEGTDVGSWGRASVWAGVDTSGETSVELCTCRGRTAEVCVVDTGGTVGAVAAATNTGVALVVDTWVLVTTFVVATVTVCSGDDVDVVTVGNGAGVAPVVVVTVGGILTVFSAVVEGVVELMCSLEGAAPTGVVTWTPSVAGDVVTVTGLVLFVVVTLADAVVAVGAQIGMGAAEDVPTTETVVTCGAT